MTAIVQPARVAPSSLRAADLWGMTRLGFDATVGITDLVEAMHHTIASRAGLLGPAATGRTRGITGLVYGAVRGTTHLLGRGLDATVGALVGPAGPDAGVPAREAVVAALNGVWGDHLEATGNPLAIPMALRIGGVRLELERGALAAQVPDARSTVVVLVHGLCMNDSQWLRAGHDHGAALARDLGATSVYLHYNTGRHVSQNGHDLAGLLEQLVAAWPVKLRDLVIVGHSMGGLVARSAVHSAAAEQLGWAGRLRALVFLGTPHHGAPLERGGQRVEMMFGASPYLAPFGRLGRARSAGITDLRFGSLRDEDWLDRDRHAQREDDRVATPLPAGVPAYAVAATRGDELAALMGDGLVPVPSALGEHRDSARCLGIPPARRMVITGANHWDLLSRADVYEQLRKWLGPAA